MNFTEYTRRSERLRHDLARLRPRAFFLVETARYAAIMALIIVISEVTPWPFRYGSAQIRLWFIGSWAAIMAGWSLWRLRSRKVSTQPSSIQ